MKKRMIELLFLVIALGLVFCGPLSLNAQEKEAEFTLEEITVTAEKRTMDIQNVSRSINVISSDDLDYRSASAVMDILSSQANINVQGFGTSLFIRGVGSAGAIMNEAGYEPSVQFNVDGNLGLEFAGSNAVATSMTDVERVEVIRGPGGAINGRMAAAGTINVITKDPSFDKIDGTVSVTAGSYNLINTSAALNLPLKLTGLDLPSYLENLSFRIALRQDKHDAYVHNSDGEDINGWQNYSTQRIKMKWQPIEDLTLSAQYQFAYSKGESGNSVRAINHVQTFPGVSQPHPDDPWLNDNATAMTTEYVAGNKEYNASVNLAWTTGFGTLNARYAKGWIPVTCDDTGGTGGNISNVCYEGDKYQIEKEVRFNSLDEARIQWMLGYYTFYKKEYAGPDSQYDAIDPNDTEIYFGDFYGDARNFNQMGYDITSPDFDANDPERSWAIWGLDPVEQGNVVFVSNSGTRPITSNSFYGNITYPFLEDKHRVSLGLRKTYENKKRLTVVGVFQPQEEDGTPTLPHFTYDSDTEQWECDNCVMVDSEDPHLLKTEDNPLSYTLGYEYDFRPEVMLYVNINNGFKPGGQSPESIPVRNYKPETMTNLAAGMKSRWFENTLQLNVEAYLMKYNNMQTSLSNECSVTYTMNGVQYTQAQGFNKLVLNLGPTNIMGVDIDYDWLISARDRLEGDISFKDAKYGDLLVRLGNSGIPQGHPEYVQYKDHTMPQAPKFSFTANYSHIFTLGTYSLTPRFDVKYSTKYMAFDMWWWDSIGAEVEQPAYWKYNAYLNFGPEDVSWQLNAYVKNIDNTVVRTTAFMDMYIEDPRTMGIGLTVKF